MNTDGKVPPVRPGDKIRVTIESIGAKGDGVGKKDNFVIIVKSAEIGKEYDVTVNKVFKTFAFAEITPEGGDKTSPPIVATSEVK